MFCSLLLLLLSSRFLILLRLLLCFMIIANEQMKRKRKYYFFLFWETLREIEKYDALTKHTKIIIIMYSSITATAAASKCAENGDRTLVIFCFHIFFSFSFFFAELFQVFSYKPLLYSLVFDKRTKLCAH
jgi:hypothetical protein